MAVRPRIQLKANKRMTLDPELRVILETGDDLLGRFEGLSEGELDAQLRELWEVHGEAVTRAFIASHPGERPALWWRYSSPEPRPVQPPAHGDFALHEKLAAQRRLEELGVLIRHNLLSRTEEEALKREARN